MHEKIHIKLTLLCSLVLSFVLIIMTFCYAYITERNLHISADASFLTNILTIASSLENQNTISSDWILQTEQNNNMIFYLLDNKIPVHHSNSLSTVKKAVIDEFIQACENQGISETYTYSTYTTHVELKFTDSNKTAYHGAYLYIPKGNSCIEVYLLSSNSPLKTQILEQRLIFVLIDFSALALLFLFFWFFTRQMLKPIQVNHEKQVQFIENASHELRSPLAVILSNVSALRRAKDSEKEVFYQAVFSEGNRMADLINSMLLLARSDLSQHEIVLETVELDTLIMNCYENYESVYLDKKVNLTLSLPDDVLSPIKSNAARITQAVGILLSNALSYTPSSGCVTLSLAISSGKYIISVADNGIGIADSEKSKVFDRFYRGRTEIKGEHHYGLGLSIATQLIKELKGTIKIVDTPGGGSTFIITLPA